MADTGSDERTRRWFEPLLRHLPAEVRYRLFKPAYEDLRADHLLRLKRAPRWPGARLACRVLFLVRVLALVAACYRGAPGFLNRRRSWTLAGAGRALLSNRHAFTHDLRQALRLLWRQPYFSGAAVLVLALGIAASAVIFAVVDAVLLRPLPFPDSSALVAIDETFEERLSSVSPVNFYDWKRQATSFSSMGIFADANLTLVAGDRAVAVNGFVASSGFFPALGIQPALGRWFGAEDDRAGGAPNVVLGYGLWQRAFGGRPEAIGEQALFDGTPYTVIGVAPEGMAFPERAEAWFSLALSERSLAPGARGAHWVEAIARLRPGVEIEEAEAELNSIAASLAAAYPRTNRGAGVRVRGLLDSMVGSTRAALFLLFGGVGCLLLISCVNVSGLLLSRTVGRRSEAAVRTALGASRIALFRQVLVESLVLSAAGGILGLLLAAWGMDALLAQLPSDLPRASVVGLDARVVLFSLALALLAGLGLGLVPAWQTTRAALAGSLQVSRHDGAAAGSARLRGLLIAAEVALALVLLVGAGVTAASFSMLARVSPGFDAREALTFWVSLPEGVYSDSARVRGFYRELDARLSALPGVLSSGAVMIPPVSSAGFGGTFTIEGRPEDPANEPRAQLRPATPDYFRALGVRVISGRGIEARDHGEAAPVAIISETAARQYWPGENPLGRKLRMHVSAVGQREPVREIVGVVQDVKSRSLQQPAAPIVYVPHEQHPSTVMTFVLRTALDPAGYGNAVVAAVRDIDKTLLAHDLRTLEEHVNRARADQRFRALLLGGFAAAAFLLAVVGLYAAVSYAAGQRRHEIGVRVALGATSRDVVRLVVGEALRPVAAGMAAGGVAAFLVSGALQGLVFGVQPFEPAVVALVAVLLGASACAACYVPARRSARVDPREALRAD